MQISDTIADMLIQNCEVLAKKHESVVDVPVQHEKSLSHRFLLTKDMSRAFRSSTTESRALSV